MLPPPSPPPPPTPPHNYLNPNPKPSTSAGGSGNPCAACRFDRQRCPPCILAPYFPPDEPERYARAHRLFGRSNIARTLDMIADPNDRDDAARAIIYEADARADNPVGGATRYIVILHRRVWSAYNDLQFVQRLIQLVRSNQNAVVLPPLPASVSLPEMSATDFAHF